eukprot:Sspe_Gene.19331::Locus_7041_Transcript_2_5_Confidence_0.200_Length_2061::g.19331::m.19331
MKKPDGGGEQTKTHLWPREFCSLVNPGIRALLGVVRWRQTGEGGRGGMFRPFGPFAFVSLPQPWPKNWTGALARAQLHLPRWAASAVAEGARGEDDRRAWDPRYSCDTGVRVRPRGEEGDHRAREPRGVRATAGHVRGGSYPQRDGPCTPPGPRGWLSRTNSALLRLGSRGWWWCKRSPLGQSRTTWLRGTALDCYKACWSASSSSRMLPVLEARADKARREARGVIPSEMCECRRRVRLCPKSMREKRAAFKRLKNLRGPDVWLAPGLIADDTDEFLDPLIRPWNRTGEAGVWWVLVGEAFPSKRVGRRQCDAARTDITDDLLLLGQLTCHDRPNLLDKGVAQGTMQRRSSPKRPTHQPVTRTRMACPASDTSPLFGLTHGAPPNGVMRCSATHQKASA